jgi:hypothetical protein
MIQCEKEKLTLVKEILFDHYTLGLQVIEEDFKDGVYLFHFPLVNHVSVFPWLFFQPLELKKFVLLLHPVSGHTS